MIKAATSKKDFPVEKVRRYLEPGPIVLFSSRWQGKTNIMTMGWHTVMEFTPSLVGCVISGASHSFHMIRGSRECVINLPTTKLTDIVVGVGNCSGADVDKFEKFSLTPLDADEVDAPLIKECHANFECRLHDDALVDKYNFFIFEVVKAHDAATPKHPETLHYTGGERRRLAGYSATIQVGGLILFDVARQRAASHPAQQTFADSGKLKEGIHAGVAAINR